jgi:hypothetical protein
MAMIGMWFAYPQSLNVTTTPYAGNPVRYYGQSGLPNNILHLFVETRVLGPLYFSSDPHPIQVTTLTPNGYGHIQGFPTLQVQ